MCHKLCGNSPHLGGLGAAGLTEPTLCPTSALFIPLHTRDRTSSSWRLVLCCSLVLPCSQALGDALGQGSEQSTASPSSCPFRCPQHP